MLHRERQRQKLQALQKRKTEIAQTVDSLQTATHENQQLEAENQKLSEQLRQLSTADGVTYMQPSTPSSTSESSYSGDSDSGSSSRSVFPTRVGQKIVATTAHKTAYQQTEQAWFTKASYLWFGLISLHVYKSHHACLFWTVTGPLLFVGQSELSLRGVTCNCTTLQCTHRKQADLQGMHEASCVFASAYSAPSYAQRATASCVIHSYLLVISTTVDDRQQASSA